MVIFKESIQLSNENITTAIKDAVDAYEKAAGDRATHSVRLSLSLEEILLAYQKCYGTDSTCNVTLNRTWGKLEFIFREKGQPFNPIASDDVDDVGQYMLSRLGVYPKYSYDTRHNVNTVSIVAVQKSKKNKTIVQTIAATVLAVICYFGISLLPAETGALIASSIVEPFFNKFTAVITSIATPLVFFSVVNGIADIGDVRTLGLIGKKFMSEIGLTYSIAGVAFTSFALIGYGVQSSSSSGGGFLKQIVQLVLDIIPDNLLVPFTIDNDLQVVVVAIAVGIALILMQKKSESIKTALVTIGDAVNQLMTLALKLIPAIVFLGVLNILCKDMKGMGNLYIMLLCFIASVIVVVGYIIIRALVVTKAPFKVLFSKQLATTMINLTTSSQVSALPENIICCKEKFGINPKLVDFGLPLGIVIYMPNGASFLALIVWALANLAGIEIDIFKGLVIMVMAIIIAIAAPPIPGSAYTVMPILMAIVNIPYDFYPIAIIAGTILGYFLPLLNGYCLQLQLLIVAKELDMVNLDTLRRPMKQEA